MRKINVSGNQLHSNCDTDFETSLVIGCSGWSKAMCFKVGFGNPDFGYLSH